MDYGFQNELILNLDKLHTTDLGVERIRGKNWYVRVGGYEITVNAYSYTIITVHMMKSDLFL